MLRIAQAHFPKVKRTLFDEVLARMEVFGARADDLDVRAPGPAEFLDALRACIALEVSGKHPDWEGVTRAAMWKHLAPVEEPHAG